MNSWQRFQKRSFDIFSSILGLVFLWPLILLCIILARRDTRASGLFRQKRIGRHGVPFMVNKIRTMSVTGGSTVTVSGDPRITPLGAMFRRWKLDELPQLWNVLNGTMSIVGPRPDVPGYFDQLPDEDKVILQLRPGMTGPATLKYRNEEELLQTVDDPQRYNDTIIWPDKVKINKGYLKNWSLLRDIAIIWKTVKS